MHFSSLIIPAAGIGKRMGSDTPKQFLSLDTHTVLEHTINFFENFDLINEIILVIDDENIAFIKNEIIDKNNYKKIKRIVPGGKERQDSVYNGLAVVNDLADVILVHDAVRPFPPQKGIVNAIRSARSGKGGVLAIPVADTLKKADNDGQVIDTIDRTNVFSIQTPQVFPAEAIKMAFEKAKRENFKATDEGMVMAFAGFPVCLFEGSASNLKITTPFDLEVAKVWAREKANIENK